jgi:hypothetical protein
MAQQNMKINREIQRVLARQDVNQKPLRHTVHGGQLNVSGRLEKNHGKAFSDPDEVEKLERHFRRIDGVLKVQWELESWDKTESGWTRS